MAISKKGQIIGYVLVFGAIFLILMSGLLGLVLTQLRQGYEKEAWNKALEIAEAGANYYHWCINHGLEDSCSTGPSGKDYLDSDSNAIGKFSFNIQTNSACNQVIQRQVTVTGWTNKFPSIKRTIKVIFARESVAKFSFVLNSDVWAGSDYVIRGPYQSNGGIRMDGQNLSTVSSAKQEWLATSTFYTGGCPIPPCHASSTQCWCPGVFTYQGNANTNLFDFPIPRFDFNGMTIDLANIKTAAQNEVNQYWPPITTLDANGKGYHLIFKNDGTFDIYIITRLNSVSAYSIEEGNHQDAYIIASEYKKATVAINQACPVIFVEDNLWVEGIVKGMVTLGAADLITPTRIVDVVLPNSIDYSSLDGSDGLVLISKGGIFIGPQSPDYMTLRGIFMAQTKRFGRDNYSDTKTRLTIQGSIISSGRVGTKWVPGNYGYQNRDVFIDNRLIYNPPPFLPFTNPKFININWEEL